MLTTVKRATAIGGVVIVVLGVALAIIGAVNLYLEGVAADAEHRGFHFTLLQWPSLFAGIILVLIGVALIVFAIVRRHTQDTTQAV